MSTNIGLTLTLKEIRLSVEDFVPDQDWKSADTTKCNAPLIIGQDDEELESIVGTMTLTDRSNRMSPERSFEATHPPNGSLHRSTIFYNRGSSPSMPRNGSFPPPPQTPVSVLPFGFCSPSSSQLFQVKSKPCLGAMNVTGQMASVGSVNLVSYDRRHRGTCNGVNNNNRVDIERIRRGEDVRTTV